MFDGKILNFVKGKDEKIHFENKNLLYEIFLVKNSFIKISQKKVLTNLKWKTNLKTFVHLK